MNVEIQTQGFPLTSALAEHAKRRLRFVLTRHSDRIQRVVVRLGDENGPRGGVDKCCRIQVHLRAAPVVLIEDIGADLNTVIERAADRVGRVVVKHLDRSRSGRRQHHADVIPASVDVLADASHPAAIEGAQL